MSFKTLKPTSGHGAPQLRGERGGLGEYNFSRSPRFASRSGLGKIIRF